MMKTSQVAQKLKLSPKTVLSIAKKINITPEKNELGHYLFTREEVLRIAEYVPQVPNRIGIVSSSTQQEASITNERLDKIEQSLRDFSYETIQYQLLQHRRELEELRQENSAIQAELDAMKQLIESQQHLKQIDVTRKRKNSFFSSIFRSDANIV
ncbi:MAG: hypothetical protein ACI35O_12020 [Bacillaceae bacterium]